MFCGCWFGWGAGAGVGICGGGVIGGKLLVPNINKTFKYKI